MGAIGEDGVRVENPEVLRACGLVSLDLDAAELRERPELERRAQAYRAGRPRIDLGGGRSSSSTTGSPPARPLAAACAVVRALGARHVIVAAPVAAARAATELSAVADAVVVVATPEPFRAVGEWYDDFTQTTDDEVVRLLSTAAGTVR